MTAKNLQRADEGGTYCHIYNKGIENRNIFANDVDYQVFLGYLEDYLSAPKAPESTKKDFTVNGRLYRGVPHQPKNYFNRVELIAYSLKPDHFHLVLHQKAQKSLQAFIRSLCTRYSIYFNKKYNHTGSLFAGPYKSIVIQDELSLLLLTRYLHKSGNYSTYPEYTGQRQTPWVRAKAVLTDKNIKGNYKNFVEKHEPNQTELELLEKITIDNANQHLERRELTEVNLKPWARIPELAAAIAVFVLLLGLGFRNVAQDEKNLGKLSTVLGKAISTTPDPTPLPSSEPTPTSTAEPKSMLRVKYTDSGIPINIRQEATTESKKIGEVKYGDKFVFLSENSSWYQVQLSDGTSGFIWSEYTEKQEETNND